MRNFLIFFLFLAAVNIAAYFLMYLDKQRAIQGKWRISENTFFLLCLLGGFIGIYAGMQQFRHKTRHLSFKIILVISLAAWCGLLPYAYFSTH